MPIRKEDLSDEWPARKLLDGTFADESIEDICAAAEGGIRYWMARDGKRRIDLLTLLAKELKKGLP